MSVFQARDLVKHYQSRPVVNKVSVEVRSGEVVGLLGPNGAGKTTCFYMMVGLVRCDEGEIRLDDQILTSQPMHVRARHGVGYLPQEPSVFRKLTVEQNILAILETRPGLDKSERRQRLEDLLQALHIGHLRDQLGLSLSGGERRRVEISRALAADPRFMLLDEPFAGIDPLSVVDIQHIVTHLKERDIGILITDHNVREALGICDRAYVINDGQVIASGSPKDIIDNQQVRDVYLGHHFQL
ncbi:MAG: LPS export ABC transporter ATP-binding protein [Gammaproteobacteria bacterium]